jgi:hypothetical protein
MPTVPSNVPVIHPKTSPRRSYVGAVELKPSDRFSILEFAEIFGFTTGAFIDAIERNRSTIRRPFYSILDLATRWRCSRATVYNVLRESEFNLLDLSLPGRDKEKRLLPCKKKGKRLVPNCVVERIEQGRMRSLSDQAA